MTTSPSEPGTHAAPFRGSFRINLKPDGTVVVPDLAEPLIPLLREAGADESLWQKQPCTVAAPVFLRARGMATGIAREQLKTMPTAALWALHRKLMQLAVPTQPRSPASTADATLLDLKILLARLLLAPCLLCERRCEVSRSEGEMGFCGLGDGMQVAAYSMLYNEGPLVGAPTFCVFLRGCSLRCSFCYRPDELQARGREETPVEALADVLDQAASAGAESWHFLGGNPDESLPGILQALALTTLARPVVWNSALMLTPPALELLKGVADIWLPDYKFGNDECARRIAGINNYSAVLQRNLRLLQDQQHLVIRHMVMPGHDACCTGPVREYVTLHHPHRLLHTFSMHSRGTVEDS